jgi:predicted peroxiredoxin
MPKVGIVLLAGTDTPGDAGRMVNAFITAREAAEAGDEVTVVLDGAGTRWIAELAGTEHKYSRLFDDVKPRIAGACAYCSRAYGVKEQVEAAGIPLLRDYADHPSLRTLIADGYEVIPF